jgi:uroporphyrin-III C-methyltransferase
VVVENCSLANEHLLRLRLDDLEQGLATCSGPVPVIKGAALAPWDNS